MMVFENDGGETLKQVQDDNITAQHRVRSPRPKGLAMTLFLDAETSVARASSLIFDSSMTGMVARHHVRLLHFVRNDRIIDA